MSGGNDFATPLRAFFHKIKKFPKDVR